MTDVRELLQTAAARPSAPVDARALVRTAQRRPWHRWMAWGAGVVALFSGAVAGDLVPAGRPDPGPAEVAPTPPVPDVGAMRPDVPTAPDPATTSIDGGVTAATVPRSPAPPVMEDTAATTRPPSTTMPPSASGAAAPAEEGSTPTSAPQSRGQGWPPPSEGCRLSGWEPATCSYVATEPAGFMAGGAAWSLEIRRGDQVIRTRAQATGEACAPPPFVRPGDHVTAAIERGPGWQFGLGSSISVGPRVGVDCRG